MNNTNIKDKIKKVILNSVISLIIFGILFTLIFINRTYKPVNVSIIQQNINMMRKN